MSDRLAALPVPPQCRDLIRAGALVAINSSGGKDSQCMTIPLSRIVPREQLLVVHAPLGEVEWPGTVEHIENTLPHRVLLILARTSSGTSLLESIEKRGRFPSPSVRWCTSSTKRGPIERELRRYLKAHLQFGGRLVNAMGMRAEENAARARRFTWKRSDRNSRAGRSWFDWLPIFDLTEAQVFDVIQAAGQSPHPAYGMGMSRLSCVFCIMASRRDLRIAARLQPSLYARYVRLEERIGHTLSPTGVPLPALTGVPVEPAPPQTQPAPPRPRVRPTVAPSPAPRPASHRAQSPDGFGPGARSPLPGIAPHETAARSASPISSPPPRCRPASSRHGRRCPARTAPP